MLSRLKVPCNSGSYQLGRRPCSSTMLFAIRCWVAAQAESWQLCLRILAALLPISALRRRPDAIAGSCDLLGGVPALTAELAGAGRELAPLPAHPRLHRGQCGRLPAGLVRWRPQVQLPPRSHAQARRTHGALLVSIAHSLNTACLRSSCNTAAWEHRHLHARKPSPGSPIAIGCCLSTSVPQPQGCWTASSTLTAPWVHATQVPGCPLSEAH